MFNILMLIKNKVYCIKSNFISFSLLKIVVLVVVFSIRPKSLLYLLLFYTIAHVNADFVSSDPNLTGVLTSSSRTPIHLITRSGLPSSIINVQISAKSVAARSARICVSFLNSFSIHGVFFFLPHTKKLFL